MPKRKVYKKKAKQKKKNQTQEELRMAPLPQGFGEQLPERAKSQKCVLISVAGPGYRPLAFNDELRYAFHRTFESPEEAEQFKNEYIQKYPNQPVNWTLMPPDGALVLTKKQENLNNVVYQRRVLADVWKQLRQSHEKQTKRIQERMARLQDPARRERARLAMEMSGAADREAYREEEDKKQQDEQLKLAQQEDETDREAEANANNFERGKYATDIALGDGQEAAAKLLKIGDEKTDPTSQESRGTDKEIELGENKKEEEEQDDKMDPTTQELKRGESKVEKEAIENHDEKKADEPGSMYASLPREFRNKLEKVMLFHCISKIDGKELPEPVLIPRRAFRTYKGAKTVADAWEMMDLKDPTMAYGLLICDLNQWKPTRVERTNCKTFYTGLSTIKRLQQKEQSQKHHEIGGVLCPVDLHPPLSSSCLKQPQKTELKVSYGEPDQDDQFQPMI